MANKKTLKTFTIGTGIPLKPCLGWPRQAVHFFDRRQAVAILAALEIKRPLLVRGEPGCGKTQLARAAAQVLGMPLVSLVVNERTETEDLFWKYDAIRRLSDAHDTKKSVDDEKEYLSAGPLWWALNHDSAREYTGKQACRLEETNTGRSFDNGVLLLIDEIDKADRSVPNSLLEALGNYSFDVPYINDRVECRDQKKAPLIIITTNEEQELPQAFVRRCLVLDLALPESKELFIQVLAQRGKALLGRHFKSGEIFTEVAEQLWGKREEVRKSGSPFLPGQAEYLDHLEAIKAMRVIDPDTDEQKAIEELAELAYKKNRS